jgi:tetratricopeptide (TPR) repeat protein
MRSVAPFRIFLVALLASAAPLHVCAQSSHKHHAKPEPVAALDPLAQANLNLQAGEADKALAQLQIDSLPQASQAQAHNLRCRVYFTMERWEEATSECEQAVKLDSSVSDYHMWLGRALGERADRASFLNAYALAKRTRSEFEQAAQLNSRNAEALADLGEFYSSAPGVVGGGTDKANAVAAQLDKVDPARAHELRARIASGQKDFTTAEREFREAITASQHPAFQWMTLASFFRGRQRWDEMEAAVHSGISAAERDKHAAVSLYNGASVLTRANRDPALAAKMLQNYLASPIKTEEAPAFVAYTRLARIKDQLGDHDGALQDRASAYQLAQKYKPAQDTKH